MTGSASLLLGAAPHLESPAKTCQSWLIEPCGMLNQVQAGAPLDLAVADFIKGAVDQAMRRAYPQPQRYLYVHDFRAATTVESGARDALIAFGRGTPKDQVERVLLLPPPGVVWRTAASAAMLALRVVGVHMEYAESLEEVFTKYRVKVGKRPVG